ncbi:ubiquitin-like domain-containing protein CIP73 isoform X2 [Hevea brasiliensis]|uniref:ubiquitin-like domain-containing protein CIP73 isoform X2 n=1 Tax=Hevea brasiliensis TaxID=3981 RepID=UPI002600AE74|nr:ubiquitin-like domain-containing protein CIP73 isoform X2 [Hevea brasiliensis]
MANQYSNDGSSTSNISGESSDAAIELNIKTLDSQIYNFQVDKNTLVSAFKEKIAKDIGVPVGQQRLIFRGKVLKDEHLLSEYQVENGHTLHLVARQPAQLQPSTDASSGDTNANNGNRGNDPSAGIPQNRVGQISHSIVLGTFNVGEQGEGIFPDLSRVIGAVLNSFGIGGQTAINGIGGMQSSNMSNVSGQTRGNETVDGLRSNVSGQSQAGNQMQPGQAFPGQPFQLPPQVMQIPLTAAVPLPSLHSPIPDSLSTLSEFMTHMEQALAQNGYQPIATSNNTGDVPNVELPSNVRGLQALHIVLRHAERLLGGHVITALSHIAERLELEGVSSNPSVRGQIQTESAQVGLAMQHIGALLLELGRTILTLRMGQSPADSSVNPGPAVYISPSGPNPIMVQPFPLQTNSLFGGSSVQSNPMSSGHVGIGSAPRNINIHINAGARASNGEGMQGERGNGTGFSGSGPVRMLPVQNVIAAAVPSHSTGVTVSVSNATQPGLGVSISQPPSDSTSLSSVIAEVNSRLRSLVGAMQGENQPTSGSVTSGTGNGASNKQPEGVMISGAGESSVTLSGLMFDGHDQKNQDDHVRGSNGEVTESFLRSKDVSSCSVGCSNGGTSLKPEETSENAPSSSEKHDLSEGAEAVPLGLAMGSLECKRKTRQPKSVVKSGDLGTSNTPVCENLNTGMTGQQPLQSLASLSSGTNRVGANEIHSSQIPSSVCRNLEHSPLGEQGSDAQFGTSSVVSQVIDSPALNGLLAGVSQQTGVGSPNVLRNMLQQLTQNPQIMSTVSQIAQQVESQDLGNMFSGLGSGQGSGIDLSRMVQQMMPVVSQVLSRGSAAQPFFHVEPEAQQQYNERRSSGNEKPNDQNVQIDLQDVAQRIGHFNAPGDIFRAVAENAGRLNGNESGSLDIVQELSNNADLVHDYIEMLQRDIHQLLQSDAGEDES